MTPDEAQNALDNLDVFLIRWGESARGERNVLGFPSKTLLYHFMMYGSSAGKRRGALFVPDKSMGLR